VCSDEQLGQAASQLEGGSHDHEDDGQGPMLTRFLLAFGGDGRDLCDTPLQLLCCLSQNCNMRWHVECNSCFGNTYFE
jgi:hypothetical protein